MGDNTVLCVVYILTKQGVKTSLPGGLLPMKKRSGGMHYTNGCGGELRQDVPCMDVKYRCVCYSLHASVICRLPKLAVAQKVGLVAETSLHLVTQASRVFIVHTRDNPACKHPQTQS